MKKFLSWLKDPHGWGAAAVLFLTAGIVAGTIICVVLSPSGMLFVSLSYALYLLAALSLGYSVYIVVRALRGLRNRKKIFRDYAFRTTVTSSVSFVINFGYAVFQAVLAVLSRSVWLGALAGYYACLCFMRGFLLFRRKTNAGKEESEASLQSAISYRNCGYFFLFLTLVFSAAVVQMVLSEKGFRFEGLMIYVAAAYAFYKIILATVNISKARKQSDLIVRSLRNVNLADALVSILALQTAMFRSFGSEGIKVGKFNGATGAAVCLLIAATGIVMAVNGAMKVKRLKAERKNDTEE